VTTPNGGYARGCVGGRLRSVITGAQRKASSQLISDLADVRSGIPGRAVPWFRY